MISPRFIFLIASALVFVGSESYGGLVLSNLDQPVAGVGQLGMVPGHTDRQQYAQEFTTGSQAFKLDSIIASLGGASGSFAPFAQLVTDSGNHPGSTVLTTFAIPSIGSAFNNLTLTPTTSGLTLAANSSYWLVLGSLSGTGEFQWQYTASTTVHGDGSLPHYAYSYDGGSTYTVNTGAPFLIQVNSVPAPPSLLLSGLAGSSLAALSRFRRRF